MVVVPYLLSWVFFHYIFSLSSLYYCSTKPIIWCVFAITLFIAGNKIHIIHDVLLCISHAVIFCHIYFQCVFLLHSYAVASLPYLLSGVYRPINEPSSVNFPSSPSPYSPRLASSSSYPPYTSTELAKEARLPLTGPSSTLKYKNNSFLAFYNLLLNI